MQASVECKEKISSLQDKNIKKHFSGITVEHIIQSLKDENSPWSNQQLETLMKMSPTSLKVTIAVLKQATKFSLQECLKIDFRVMTRLVFEKDFLEGVRASVIDKDNKPNWNPSALKPVSEEKFQSILAPLQADKEQSFKYDNCKIFVRKNFSGFNP